MKIDEPPTETPPPAPKGKGAIRNRAMMYAHNRKVAQRRWDLTEQVEQGILPASALADLPPLGPTGKGHKSQRAKIYAHNRKLAARRQKAAQDDPPKS